jgi:5'-3' exonuclease
MQQVTIDGLEADDVIAVLACAAVGCGSEAIVYSMDNDFWQLIHHGVQVIVDTDKKRDLSCVTPEDIDKKYACSPENLLAMRCMLGDGSDNITNPIRGIGPAKAKKFFEAGLDVAASFDDQPHPVKALVQNAENMEAINVRHKVMRLPTTLTELQFTQAAHAATALAAMYIGQTSSSVVYPELKKVLEEFEIINVDRQLALAVFCPKI